MNSGFYGYAAASLGYSFFTLLLLFSWSQSQQARRLTIVMIVSVLWTLFSASLAYGNTAQINWYGYWLFDAGRYIAWYVFLLKLFEPVAVGEPSVSATVKPIVDLSAKKNQQRNNNATLRWLLPLSLILASFIFIDEVYSSSPDNLFALIGHLLLALIAMFLLEQVYRHLPVKYRWAMKYLIIGAGSIFVFDFYFYADGLLFHKLDPVLWQARGFIHFMAIPLLAISAARSKNWSLNLFVSRDIVLNSAVVMGGGLYLVAMSFAGYYLREFGGGWGKIGQVTLITLALILLLIMILSGQLRAKVRVFLGKHFYKNKYDYRIEWLKLTEELNVDLQQVTRSSIVVQSMAQIIDARAGMLWLEANNKDQPRKYRNIVSWQSTPLDDVELGNSVFIRFMESKQFVINIKDINIKTSEYSKLELPAWIDKVTDPWIVVPLFDAERLLGFVLLAQPLVARAINWEDRDLLKTAARQVASHLKVLITSTELAEAKQFEVFSRLSAYMVHDLKNIAAELELVAQNARRHSANPAFVEDAFETVEHASTDIKRLLVQLRNRKVQIEKKVQIDLPALILEVVKSRQSNKPQPVFTSGCDDCMVAVEPGQLRNVLAHLIENAQQATDDTGEVVVSLAKDNAFYIVSIKDSGQGMDAVFIQNRLFKPFDTTKGNAGMGIGMYESRDFIRHIGGDIVVQSKPKKGSIISLHIPVMKKKHIT